MRQRIGRLRSQQANDKENRQFASEVVPNLERVRERDQKRLELSVCKWGEKKRNIQLKASIRPEKKLVGLQSETLNRNYRER